ncbi:MAG: helix-turn-helix transcriptional regulator [Steroidobacteraceae bacterium]
MIRVSFVACEYWRRIVSRRSQLRSAAYTARAQRAEATLDAIAAAALIVSGTGRLAHRNRAAGALLDRQDGLLLRDSHLCATDPLVQWKLQGLIAAGAGARGRSPAGAVLGVPRPSGKHLLQVAVLPLSPGEGPSAQVLVLVGDPEETGRVPAEALAALYGLTAAETHIANALLLGRSIAQIAGERGVTAGTLRGQIKSIFRKTNTHRQSELIRLLLSVPDSVSQRA